MSVHLCTEAGRPIATFDLARVNARARLRLGTLGMSVHQLFRNTAFGPEEIAVLVAAYEATLKKLGLVDRDDPLTQMIAKKILEVAERGIRDAEQLSALALSEMRL